MRLNKGHRTQLKYFQKRSNDSNYHCYNHWCHLVCYSIIISTTVPEMRKTVLFLHKVPTKAMLLNVRFNPGMFLEGLEGHGIISETSVEEGIIFLM